MTKKEAKKQGIDKYIIPVLLVVIILLLLALILVVFHDKFIASNRENSTNLNESIENNSVPNSKENTQSNSSTTEKYISSQKALTIALNDIGATQSDVYDVDVELDYKYKQNVYEVSFNYRQYEYEYYLNATTGKIIHAFKERD